MDSMISRSPAEAGSAGPLAPRLFLSALALAILALVSALYVAAPDLYRRLLVLLMATPFDVPFIDAQQIPALLECRRQGIDVYVSAPCDPFGRALAYSPLFMRASFLPPWGNWMGLLLAGAACMALALLPAPRGRAAWAATILALVSGQTVYALERANMDVLMFVLIAVGGALAVRTPLLRLTGYAFITLAGFLKFYPLVLWMLFLREQWGRFLLLCAAGAALLAVFVLFFADELQKMVRNLPGGPAFTDWFGSHQLAMGAGEAVSYLLIAAGWDSAFARSLPTDYVFGFKLLLGAMLVAALLTGWLATRPALRAALADLPVAHATFLAIGAALMASCFAAGQNVAYRGIHFLFVLPGLLLLAGEAQQRSVRRLSAVSVLAILFVMWGLTGQQLVALLLGGSGYPAGGGTGIYVYWLMRELVWWWLFCVLLAVVLVFVTQSRVFRTRWRAGETATAPTPG